MMLRWRKFEPGDYDQIAGWYTGHGWDAAPQREILPTTGFIVEDGIGPVAVAFLYMSNSPLAWISWPATRPGLPPGRTSTKVLQYLMEQLREAGKGSGVEKFVFLTRPKTARIYEKMGFEKVEERTLLVG